MQMALTLPMWQGQKFLWTSSGFSAYLKHPKIAYIMCLCIKGSPFQCITTCYSLMSSYWAVPENSTSSNCKLKIYRRGELTPKQISCCVSCKNEKKNERRKRQTQHVWQHQATLSTTHRSQQLKKYCEKKNAPYIDFPWFNFCKSYEVCKKF